MKNGKIINHIFENMHGKSKEYLITLHWRIYYKIGNKKEKAKQRFFKLLTDNLEFIWS